MEHQGNPSGNPFTTSLNSLSNMLLMVYAYRQKHGECTSFFKKVHLAIYGDDCLIAVKDASVFNVQDIHKAVSPVGMSIKSETGTWDPVDITDAVFLKRGFNLIDGRYVPTIDERSIIDIINWNKTGINEMANLDVVQNRIISAAIFCFFHQYAKTKFLDGKAFDFLGDQLKRVLCIDNVLGRTYKWRYPVYEDLEDSFKGQEFDHVSTALLYILDNPVLNFSLALFPRMRFQLLRERCIQC
jgi:hypothetical protein